MNKSGAKFADNCIRPNFKDLAILFRSKRILNLKVNNTAVNSDLHSQIQNQQTKDNTKAILAEFSGVIKRSMPLKCHYFNQ